MAKIALVGIVGVPGRYGGFETLAEHLILNWPNAADHFLCFCEKKSKSLEFNFSNTKRLFLPLRANGASSILYDLLGILIAVFNRCDVIILLGISGAFSLLFLRVIPKKYRPKIITNIDGIEWRRQKWRYWQRALLKKLERVAVLYSDIVIADNKAVQDYVMHTYGIDSQLIAYGGDHVRKRPERDSADFKCELPYFFKVCRIEPENNIELILLAFSKVPNERLVIVGNWSNSDYGILLRKNYRKFVNIEILDPIYDLDILYNLRCSSKGFIHGHSAGGTNPSLVEAMFFKKSIFAFDCDFNRHTLRGTGNYFNSAEELVDLLNSGETTLCRAHEEILSVAEENYCWRDITASYYRLVRN